MRDAVPRQALKAPFRGGTVGDLAKQVLEIAEAGLHGRAKTLDLLSDESHFIAPLKEIADSGQTPAERTLEAFNGRWEGSVDPAFTELAY